jgi:hypothetical protein
LHRSQCKPDGGRHGYSKETQGQSQRQESAGEKTGDRQEIRSAEEEGAGEKAGAAARGPQEKNRPPVPENTARGKRSGAR